MMKVTKIETIRVMFEDGYYVDITPNAEEKGYYDFWLYRKGYGVSEFMFSTAAENEEDAIELAESNYSEYISEEEDE